MNADLELSAGVEMSTGTGDALQRQHTRDRVPTAAMYDTLIPQNPVAMPAAGPGAVVLSGPPPGQLWHVRMVTWTAGDDHTLVANSTCAVYIASGAGQLLGQLLAPGQAIPGFEKFAYGAAVMHANEQLIFVFYGVNPGVALNGNARVEKYKASRAEANWVPGR